MKQVASQTKCGSGTFLTKMRSVFRIAANAFSSEAWGGRSANRGQSTQACRLPYGLVVNGELLDMEDIQYLLISPQDLCELEQVPIA